LASVKSLGFRGEALSSLCALAHLCVWPPRFDSTHFSCLLLLPLFSAVVTRTAEFDAATRLEYDHNGVIQSQSAAAREIGTTVELRNLFHSLPVRLQEVTED
jgi:DNA mismatch repair protein PMS2